MSLRKLSVNSVQIRILVVSFVINIIYFIILQVSSQTFWYLFSLKIVYAFINMGIIFAFICILYAFTSKVWVSETIFGVLCIGYAIINIYVVEFHRTPLTIPEFKNAGTALNVLKGYSLIELKPIILLFALCILSFINFLLIKKLIKYEMILTDRHRKKNIWGTVWKRGSIVLCGCVYIIGILHIDWLIEPMRGTWHFKEAVGKYGYPLYFLVSGLEYEINVPLDYSEEKLASILIDDYVDHKDSMQTPDIILILNETFYDISVVTDIETDTDYMKAFYDMDNSISGYVIVPKIGGGTNNSEYELLTANSTYLMQGITPFQTLDMSGAVSVVSNLKEMDYYTIAMHPAVSENYVRNIAYPDMGFDEIYFLNDFENVEYYGKRDQVMDKSAYENLINWYENALQKQKPVFSYLLTIQNHGEWVSNPPDDDVVHVTNCDKRYMEKLNEYLSCISLSTEALYDLIEYFKMSDRQIIVCMVGDHAPSFIEEIAGTNEYNALLQRATPFIIWANFPIEEKRDVMVSMNELVPVLLETAGVRMIPYYKFLSRLGNDIPVLTCYGEYVDKNGNIYTYTDSTKYTNAIQEYFWLEYNNLQKTRRDEWYSLQTIEK